MTSVRTGSATPRSARTTVAIGIAELATYAGLVVCLTWPLAIHLDTHLPTLPGVFAPDVPHGIWTLAWNARALATAPGTLFDPGVFHPTPRAAFYAPSGLGPVPFFAPLFLATGDPLLAYNLTLLGCFALTAWGVHRVTEHWTGSRLAGFVAGCTIAMSPLWTTFLTNWPTYLSTYYLPWIAALLALPVLRVREVVILGVLIALQCLADLVYLAPATVAPVVVVAIGRLALPRRRRAGLQLLAALAGAAIVLAPLYAGYLGVHAAVMGPSSTHPTSSTLWREYAVPLSLPWQAGFAPVTYTCLALILAGVCSLLWWRGAAEGTGRAWRHGALWTVVGLCLSAHVVVLFGMSVQNPLYVLAGAVAPRLLDVIRGNQRLSFGLTMGLALLAGAGFGEFHRRVGRGSRSFGCLVALAAVTLTYAEWRAAVTSLWAATPPYRLLEVSAAMRADSPLVEVLRRGQGPVLELPPNRSLAADASYRSIFHRRPILNGYSIYAPPGFSERMTLAARLPAAVPLESLVRETGLRTLVVHTRYYGPAASQWLALAERGGQGRLRLVARDGDDLVFDVTP